MVILPVKQIQEWDQYTIQHEPIASIDLMERASRVFTRWFTEQIEADINTILLIVSKGNNGGDGLAVARMLCDLGFHAEVLICHIQKEASPDFATNLDRLKHKNVKISHLNKDFENFPSFDCDVIIDGIFGSGLTRPVEGEWGKLIEHINDFPAPVYSIDIPSGMFGDKENPPEAKVIRSHNCLSFELPKLAFFLKSNQLNIPKWEVRSIALMPEFLQNQDQSLFFQEENETSKFLKDRKRFDHKGDFGRVLIAGGKKGMAGAPSLSCKAALKSGAGLVYALVPDSVMPIVQISVPEAVCLPGYGEDELSACPGINDYDAIAIGPGLGESENTKVFLEQLLLNSIGPLVLDADALNIIAKHQDLLKLIPKGSILTPHPGEFKRLFGKAQHELAELDLLKQKAKELQLIIVLKGAYTAIALTDGKIYFNSTGNPGMASGGSGDVLTGIICALLGQGYLSSEAARLGVMLHGLAGDIAAEDEGQEAMTASSIIQNSGKAFQRLRARKT